MRSPNQPYSILIADDSPVYRKLIEHILCTQRYALFYAKDGKQALHLYREHSPSIVITDWMMPDVSGVELCRQIRSDNSRPYTYIILMTAKTQPANVMSGLTAGADDYLTKPFNGEEMLARIGVGWRIIELNRELGLKNERLEAAARTDPLTGLPNRRALEEWSSKLLTSAVRHGFHFWVVLCDIDLFKTINDTFGHEAGDAVLCGFADLLKQTMRKSDIAGRLGGDEFLMVITHVDRDGIGITLNRLREKFASLSFSRGGHSIKTTASFGAVDLQGRELQDFKELLRKADQMLYEAKRKGRNRIETPFLSEGVPASLAT